MPSTEFQPNKTISDSDREGFYKVLHQRRDVRSQFLSKPIEKEALTRILEAAHHAPSVGFMQPWNFIVIKSLEVKTKIHQAFLKANQEAELLFKGERGDLYKKLKLEGILEAPLNICITCDRNRGGEHVLGRSHQQEMDIYSSVCAVQNFWLAARAEGLGVGWVSIIDKSELQKHLKIPSEVVPIAYLCLGHVSDFYNSPELEQRSWQKRLPLNELIFHDQWNQKEE